MADKLFNVFVYGTLKRGEPNHNWFNKPLNGHYKFISEAATEEKYPLIIGTKYNIPFLLYKPGIGYNVKGELYEVDEAVLKYLDELEDHPNFYIREEHFVIKSNNSNKIKAWIYFIKNFQNHLLQKQMFESYSNEGDHGLKYVTRSSRDVTYSVKGEIINEN